jgi:hypothetical protein
VLRSFSGVESLKAQFERDCKGNLYATTIHGINSAVIKLSKLQVACPVYRGSTRAVLPPQFWEKDGYGLSGGVEFGFTSTTIERSQAVHYAQGQASLVFESAMGLIDRGADVRRALSLSRSGPPCSALALTRRSPPLATHGQVSWLSQCAAAPLAAPVSPRAGRRATQSHATPLFTQRERSTLRSL